MQDFLDLYYEACSVLQKEEDFYDLMYEYLHRASEDNVFVAEIFFDPQTHTERGVPFATVINGLHRAILDGYRDFNIKGSLIMCYLRHLPEEKHLQTLEQAKPFLDKILGVGLDSGEINNEPSKFVKVFEESAKLGLKIVAHAGEEGGPNYIEEALDLLHARRIDHGVQCLKDEKLVERLKKECIPLTVCPLSNEKLQVYSRFFSGKNITKQLLDLGLKVCINSDDPAYFGGYITKNFLTAASETGMTEHDIHQICVNAFNATFLPIVEKEFYLRKLKQFNISSGFAPPPKSITVFGSRSTQPGSPIYGMVKGLAARFSRNGYRVVNGGYYGSMGAATEGASDEQGTALGVLCPRVFTHRGPRGHESLTHVNVARDLCDRITRMLDASEYIFIFPGTLGTLTELAVSWNVSMFRKIRKYPCKMIFLYRDPYFKAISDLNALLGMREEDAELLRYFDDIDVVFKAVEKDRKDREQAASLK